MGCGTSTDYNEININIKYNTVLDKDRKEYEKIVKLLMLGIYFLIIGPGDTGKSTIIKQFRIIHTQGFTEADKLEVFFIFIYLYNSINM